MDIPRLIMAMVALSCSVPTAHATLIDAEGDAVAAFDLEEPLLDIDTISITYDAESLFFEMTFHTPIAAPSSGLLEAVVGFIDFDLDQSDETGVAPLQNTFAPPFAALTAGMDVAISLGSELLTPGLVEIIDPETFMAIGSVPIEFGPTSLSGVIPLSLLGDDGLVDFAAIIGTFGQPTDAADRLGTAKAVPAAGTLAYLMLAFGVAGRRRR